MPWPGTGINFSKTNFKMEEKILYHLRKDYSKISLDTEHLNKDPFVQFGEWFDNALSHESQEANAMILSTSSISGKPSSRVVLLKSFSKQGFVFFTNYNSKKGKDIEENPNVSVLFFWPSAMRQIRIEGFAKKTSQKISENYFYSRPRESQASSALSMQSAPLEQRESFDNSVKTLAGNPGKIIKPKHWGGYNITPRTFEFWQGRIGRSHDRFLYTQENGIWKITPLYP